mgnify:FL=1
MLKDTIIIISSIVLIAGILFIFFGENEQVTFNKFEFNSETSESTVTIDLVPKSFNENKLYVDIRLDTHIVDLSKFDLKKVVTLEFDNKFVNPISAPELTGHHSSGTLIFEIDEKPETFKIKINDIPDIPVRNFEW